jgi:hypothetical protein
MHTKTRIMTDTPNENSQLVASSSCHIDDLSMHQLEIIFNKCFKFVKELDNVFGQDIPEIHLYYRLMNDGAKHEKALRTHAMKFYQSLSPVHEAIRDYNIVDVPERIAFSSRVYIPLKRCLIESDTATQNIIFNHLQIILMLLDPSDSELKNQVKQEIEKELNKDNETKFLESFMGDVEESLSGQEFSDPMQATVSLLKSGFIFNLANKIGAGIEQGNISLDKLVSKVTEQASVSGAQTDQLGSMMNMVGSMMGVDTSGFMNPDGTINFDTLKNAPSS